MRNLQVFVHISLDGFVATINKEINWIKVDDEIFDYAGKLIAEADTAIYGRVTFQMMDAYWPTAADHPNPTKHEVEHSAWYKRVQKYVLSKTHQKSVFSNTTILSHNIPEEINKIKRKDGKNIIMLGSPSSAQFLMKNDLVDEFWLFVNPIILGQGIQFFKDNKEMQKLKLLSSKEFSCGVVALHYKRISE